jgi:hypothetical protein
MAKKTYFEILIMDVFTKANVFGFGKWSHKVRSLMCENLVCVTYIFVMKNWIENKSS